MIHCTATVQTATITQIQAFWRDGLKWERPGFHYLICPDGKRIQLLGNNKISNGVAGHNHECIHIAYIGGIDETGKATDNRTAAQKDALLKLLRELKYLFLKAKILGHRDFSDNNPYAREQIKECPCFKAIPEYNHL